MSLEMNRGETAVGWNRKMKLWHPRFLGRDQPTSSVRCDKKRSARASEWPVGQSLPHARAEGRGVQGAPWFRGNRHAWFSMLCGCVLLLAVGGCGGKSASEPLPVADIPTAIEKAFDSAPDQVKTMATQVAKAIRMGDYQFAYHNLQVLARRADLDNEQLSVVKRAMLTVAN